MAKKDKNKDQTASGREAGFLMSATIALVFGAASGVAFGYFLMPNTVSSNSSPQKEPPAPSAPTAGRFPDDAVELAIPSIITDLDSSTKLRARLDVSIVVAHGTSETTTLLGEVREDVIAYLKGLTVDDIQGVRGFQNLREQLDDRARVRGRGAILGLLIGGLVLE